MALVKEEREGRMKKRSDNRGMADASTSESNSTNLVQRMKQGKSALWTVLCAPRRSGNKKNNFEANSLAVIKWKWGRKKKMVATIEHRGEARAKTNANSVKVLQKKNKKERQMCDWKNFSFLWVESLQWASWESCEGANGKDENYSRVTLCLRRETIITARVRSFLSTKGEMNVTMISFHLASRWFHSRRERT